jgi:hypothetical protein
LVESFGIKIPDSYNYMSGEIKFTITDSNKIPDLNSLLIKDRDSFQPAVGSFLITDNNVEINIDTKTTSQGYTALVSELNKLGFTNLIEIPTLNSIIYLENENSDVNSTKNKLTSINLNVISVQQGAFVDISKITLNNKVYTFKNEIAKAWVNYPADKNKTTYLFNVQGYVTRNELLNVAINEAK